MQHLAKALDVGAVLKLRDVFLETVGRRPAGDHRTNHRIVGALAQLDDVFRLGFLLRRIDVHFHVDALDDVQSLGGLEVIGHEVVLGEGRPFRDPRELELLDVPEVLVCVDDGDWGRLFFRRLRLRARPCAGDADRGCLFQELTAIQKLHGSTPRAARRAAAKRITGGQQPPLAS